MKIVLSFLGGLGVFLPLPFIGDGQLPDLDHLNGEGDLYGELLGDLDGDLLGDLDEGVDKTRPLGSGGSRSGGREDDLSVAGKK